VSRGSGQRGQATVEWIGLVLGLALAFAGALGATRGADFGGEASGLGEALASRVTCAARDGCGAGQAGAGSALGLGEEALGRGTGGFGGSAGRALGRPPRPRPPATLDAFGGRGIRPSAPWERFPRGLRGLEGAGSGVLRALGRAGKRAWIFCLGYRRVRYELDHPRTPRQGIPPREILDALNECLNPWQFLFP
jgi:hypothetical protein